MNLVLRCLRRAVADMDAPGVPRLLIFCGVACLIGLGLCVGGTWWWLAQVSWFEHAWLSFLSFLGGGVMATVLAWFLFPLLMPLLIGIVAEPLAGCIERASYPNTPTPAAGSFWGDLWQDIRFVLLALGLNLLVLPLYLIPVINLGVFFGLNGTLLGREFFTLVAGRHRGKRHAVALMKQHRGKVFMAGVLIAGASTLPFVNLIAPAFGVALMVHLYHALSPTSVGP